MKRQQILEGKAKIQIDIPKKGIVSKELEVFYNPVMKLNRDLSIVLLNSIEETDLQIADPLAGSGVRAARFLIELKKDKIGSIDINDYDEKAVELIKTNMDINKEKIGVINHSISNMDANDFLQGSNGFDYIDIDPFGSPNQFLDNAVKRISRKGILAVTATDTSALSGTYPKAGMRKYWAETIRQEHKHEAGIRILIRKCQLVAAQYDKELTPILAYSLDHYFRIFFKVKKSKDRSYESINSHRYFHYCSSCANHLISRANKEKCCKKEMQRAGPMWVGQLFDKGLIKKMERSIIDNSEDNEKMVNLFSTEAQIEKPFFYDIHAVCKKNKLKIPKTEILMQKIIDKGYAVSRTHFLKTSLKTDMPFNEFMDLLR